MSKKVLMKGNEVIAEAAIQAGCRAFFGYPITPQNEVPEYMSAHIEKRGGVFVQAESEVAAINMCYGASATGARVMTSSSSPGMALKQEGISYMSGADLPVFMVNVSRCGPGLGGILPAQGDYFMATKGGGNGDYRTPVFAPAYIQEASDLVFHAFDVSEKYRTPVLMLVDGMLGQMMEPVEIKPRPPIAVDKSWVTDGNTDKRAPNVVNSLSLLGDVLERQNIERFKKYAEIEKNEVMVENTVRDGDTVAIVAYGVPARIAQNAVEELAEEGIPAGIIRPITLWPFPYDVFQNLPPSVRHILVIELSMGQMIEDVKLGVNGKYPVHFYGRCGGVVFEPVEIADKVREIVKGGAK
ncbi:MAG: 3-methyl-2-oxobutanoate dehydrogenase subunit VorB [Defluviitaleaceae bacterium]|nr:3-methyl-2-oxobutanoate dehydrogenase subunit VorB [Defluviitaleaceae bacterium]MCL2239336.1 3-methyl-2-oxobutanoate dehydrogenase subunit VorB [Defluviitaleaceae bacterium]